MQGKSYTEINKLLGVPKSTLSGWFSELILSESARNRIKQLVREKSVESLIKRNKAQTSEAIKRVRLIRQESAKDIRKLSKSNLFYIGIALYWAEGYKRAIIKNGRERTYHPISMTNSDPYLIRIFIKFLTEYCHVPKHKLKGSLRLYKHINEKKALEYWSGVTGIPVKNFGKAYFGVSRSSMGKRPFNRLPFGTIQVRVSDTRLFHRIIGWIEALKKLS